MKFPGFIRQYIDPHPLSRLTAALLLVSAAVFSHAGARENPIRFELDHPDGVYAEGETAVLTISLPPEIAAADWTGAVSWERNWAREEEPVEWPVPAEPFVLKFSDKGPSQYIVTASLASAEEGGPTHRKSIGILFQPEAIQLAANEPDDFDSFWNEQKAKWRGLREEIEMVPVDSGDPEVLAWDVTIHLAENETPVSGYLARRANASAKSLPAILTLHGAGYSSAGLGGVVGWAKEGFLAMDINAHGLPNGKSGSFYKEKGRELAGFQTRVVESPEEWHFHGMYLRVVLALDLLADSPEWNGKDLVAYGSSQGGGQAIAGSGLDPRVTLMALSVPAMCDLSGSLLGRRGGWARGLPPKLDDAEERAKVYRTFQYFDSGFFAKRSRAEAIVSIGLIDRTCPADAIQASINHLQNDLTVLYRPEMPHAIPVGIKAAFKEKILNTVTFPGI